jgi:hypothetical protein
MLNVPICVREGLLCGVNVCFDGYLDAFIVLIFN